MSPGGLRIPLVDLAHRHAESAAAVELGVLAVLRSGRWTGGPWVARVEAAVAERFGRAGAVGVASGTDALILGLQALGVQPGDEVAVPALTFFATAGAVCAIGAVPRVIDVDERGLMDPQALRDAPGERLRAVIPVHLFGNHASAGRLGVPTLDDAAQAVGTDPPASTGLLTAISVYPTKAWSGAGDGGFVVGDDTAALERVRRLGSHGLVGPHLHDAVMGHVGRNSRLDPVAAAVLLGQLPSLDARIRRRRAIARLYDAHLPGGVRAIPRDAGNPVPVYVLGSPDRDGLAAHLHARGVESTVYYPRPLHHQPALAGRIPDAHAPVAERLCRELLAIPVRASLTDAEVEHIADALAHAPSRAA